MRIVHYVNQFFAGIGGEEAASVGPGKRDGAIGPARALGGVLGPEHEIVATIFCGDDHIASSEGAASELVALARAAEAELLVAGPAFGSGRYGLGCARVIAAAAGEGLPGLAAMAPENPGLEEAGAATVVQSAATARGMRESVERLAKAIARVAAGEELTAEDGRIGRIPRRNRLAAEPAAVRAVELVLARLAGESDRTEVPLPTFDAVEPAAPVEDLGRVRVALMTEGAVVPAGNPDRLESARATRWLAYEIDGLGALEPGEFESVHGGFSTAVANQDPNRLLPLDAARELERDGAIGVLHNAYLTTAGNGTQVATARRFGVEWAAELRKAGVQAAILTST